MKRNGAAEKKQSRGFLSLLIEMLAVALGIGKRKCPSYIVDAIGGLEDLWSRAGLWKWVSIRSLGEMDGQD